VRKNIMGVYFHNVDMTQAVDIAMTAVRDKTTCRVVTPNAEIGMLCKRDDTLRRVVNESGLVLPDGIGVVYAAKILGTPLKGKVAGVEFADHLAAALAAEGRSLYLFGGKPGVAEEAAAKLLEKHPGLRIAGIRDGYFKQEEEPAIVSAIRDSGADALFVCLGAPKQELWMDKWQSELSIPVTAGLGGSLDVISGQVKRAPDIFIKLGLEWFYRLLTQPKRFFRMLRLPVYLLDAVIYKLKGGDRT